MARICAARLLRAADTPENSPLICLSLSMMAVLRAISPLSAPSSANLVSAYHVPQRSRQCVSEPPLQSLHLGSHVICLALGWIHGHLSIIAVDSETLIELVWLCASNEGYRGCNCRDAAQDARQLSFAVSRPYSFEQAVMTSSSPQQART